VHVLVGNRKWVSIIGFVSGPLLKPQVPAKHVYIIDVHVLKKKAFETPSATGLTLKAVLESDSVPKVFFDVRRDSDALFAHY